jgi:hypothetical protein
MQTNSSANEERPVRVLVSHVLPSELSAIREARSWEDHEPGSAPDSLLRSLSSGRIVSDEDLQEIGRSALVREYREDVRSYADEILSSILDPRDAEDESPDNLRETIEERTWETVDGSAWTFVTYRALQVLSVSDNADYTVREFGADGIADETGLRVDRLAFGALYADLSEEIAETFAEYEETRETFEDGLQEFALSFESVRLVDSGSAYADRYGLEILLPDETVLRYGLSENADAPNGVSYSVETLSEDARPVSIVSPSVPEPVRIQTLRILESVRESVRAEFRERTLPGWIARTDEDRERLLPLQEFADLYLESADEEGA